MAASEPEIIFIQMDVSMLECHFKWFNELDDGVNRKWRSLLLNKQLHNDLFNRIEGPDIENSLDEADEHQYILNSQRLAILSWRFTLILRATFEKNYADAFQITKGLLSLKEVQNLSQSQVHIDTFLFIVLANQLNILKGWRSLGDCPVNDDEVIEIWNKIESLRNSCESDEGKAFVNAMKSNLSRDMQDAELRIYFAQKATELNPECICWHHTLYSALRSLRRSTDFRKHPSQQEIDCCEKSFELWSNQHGPDISIGIAVQMARLYSELLFSCERGTPQHQEISAKAVKFARDAVRLKPKSFTMKIRLVSLLTSYHFCGNRGYSNEERAEVQKLVKECEANVGQCTSEICHKIGKYYDSTKNVDFNSAKALEWFERSLDVHKANFPCFADMLRNKEFRRKSSAEIIDKIDTILDAHPKQCFQCQLKFIKGFFLWTVDKEEAFHLWLNVVEEATDLNVNFVSLALHNTCYLKDKNRSQALQLMRNVRFFMSRTELANSDDRSFMVLKNIVNSVIEGLEQPKPRWN